MEEERVNRRGILIVDDLRFMRILIRDILQEGGFAVAGEAVNGKEALDLYESAGPELVLLDIMMPVMDGLTALKILKKKHPSSKVIMCSTLGQQEYIIEAVRYGADDFVVKPFCPDRLLSSVKKQLI